MSKTYFNSLNYTIGNEDTTLEFNILTKNAGHVFTVAGSGSRVIPLLAKNPNLLTCVDSSVGQLSFTELRIASLQNLNYEDFLAFWGYPPRTMSSSERRDAFSSFNISDASKKITSQLLENNNWESLLYTGRWEQTFQKLSRINRRIIGEKGLKIFSYNTKEEQRNYLKTKFPKRAWSFSVFMLGNAAVFNAMLYKGSLPKKNIQKSMHAFYMEKFDYLFEQDLVRKNYFLQLLFFGRLQFPEGLLAECRQDIFLKAKKALQHTEVKYIHGDIVEELQRASRPVDFVSFSDIPSYFNPPQEQEFLQTIKNTISSKGIIVCRYYLRIPESLSIAGYRDITKNFKAIIKKEKIQMYSFGIYQKN